MEGKYSTVMMNTNDKVAVALTTIPEGTMLQVACNDQTIPVLIKEIIEFGHKFAVVSIASGEDIVKYGEVIGVAVKDIAAGEHVHVHNLEGIRGRGDLVGNVIGK